MSGRLPRRVDQDAAAGVLDHFAGLVDSQFGAIALLAHVQEDEVANAVAARPLEDRSHKLRGLPIGQMSPISKVACDQAGDRPDAFCMATS